MSSSARSPRSYCTLLCMSVQLRLPFAPPIRGPISRSTIYRVQPEPLGESGALARVGGTVDRNHHGLVHRSKSAYCTLACAGVQFQPETVQDVWSKSISKRRTTKRNPFLPQGASNAGQISGDKGISRQLSVDDSSENNFGIRRFTTQLPDWRLHTN